MIPARFQFTVFLAALLLTAVSAAAQNNQPEEFVSILGRFGISMPAPHVDYRPFAEFKTSNGQKFSSSSYRWTLDSDQVVVSFGVGSVELEDPAQSANFLTMFRDDYAIKGVQGSVIGEKKTTLGGHPGLVFVVDSAAGRVMAWIYVVRNRFYLISLSLTEPTKTEEHVKIVSTFRFLTRDQIEPRYKQLTAELTPDPLPETPPLKRPTSDAQDIGLKGKVKTVVTEGEKYEGAVLFNDPSKLSVDTYNENGNLTRRELYSGDLPRAVRLYGYLKGDRVYKEVRKFPDLVMANPDPQKKNIVAKAKPPEQKLFTIKYKYNADQLMEIHVNSEDGKEYEKYLFKPKEKKVEYTYDPGSALFGAPLSFSKETLISLLDDKGNVVEDTLMTPTGNVDYDNRYKASKFKHSYEFDERGNWIKQTTVAVISGKREVPNRVTYRKITYYQ